ncbi:MAG: ferric iron uptake transcriptional regulator [Gammaproteobacteria bacterium]|nr:MAG: ferric iron uptake transcriptional regulator [Gammaproteobacteria bacterium]
MDNITLKNAGLKGTLPRIKVLNVLEAHRHEHLSADDIYHYLQNEGEEASLATIYRILTQFEAAEIVLRHSFETGHAVYELNEGEHHDHILCIRCGRVDEFVDDTIEKRQAVIAEKAGYMMTDHQLNIFGVCPECQESDQKGKRQSDPSAND